MQYHIIIIFTMRLAFSNLVNIIEQITTGRWVCIKVYIRHQMSPAAIKRQKYTLTILFTELFIAWRQSNNKQRTVTYSAWLSATRANSLLNSNNCWWNILEWNRFTYSLNGPPKCDTRTQMPAVNGIYIIYAVVSFLDFQIIEFPSIFRSLFFPPLRLPKSIRK